MTIDDPAAESHASNNAPLPTAQLTNPFNITAQLHPLVNLSVGYNVANRLSQVTIYFGSAKDKWRSLYQSHAHGLDAKTHIDSHKDDFEAGGKRVSLGYLNSLTGSEGADSITEARRVIEGLDLSTRLNELFSNLPASTILATEGKQQGRVAISPAKFVSRVWNNSSAGTCTVPLPRQVETEWSMGTAGQWCGEKWRMSFPWGAGSDPHATTWEGDGDGNVRQVIEPCESFTLIPEDRTMLLSCNDTGERIYLGDHPPSGSGAPSAYISLWDDPTNELPTAKDLCVELKKGRGVDVASLTVNCRTANTSDSLKPFTATDTNLPVQLRLKVLKRAAASIDSRFIPTNTAIQDANTVTVQLPNTILNQWSPIRENEARPESDRGGVLTSTQCSATNGRADVTEREAVNSDGATSATSPDKNPATSIIQREVLRRMMKSRSTHFDFELWHTLNSVSRLNSRYQYQETLGRIRALTQNLGVGFAPPASSNLFRVSAIH